MIVVDSSVWISQLRGAETAAVLRLQAIDISDEILLGDLILLEILQGARDDAHAARLARQMRKLRLVTMLNEELAVEAARSYRRLRERGITVRKTIDVIIATFCIVNGYPLLHQDRDFDPMERYLGLTVA